MEDKRANDSVCVGQNVDLKRYDPLPQWMFPKKSDVINGGLKVCQLFRDHQEAGYAASYTVNGFTSVKHISEEEGDRWFRTSKPDDISSMVYGLEGRYFAKTQEDRTLRHIASCFIEYLRSDRRQFSSDMIESLKHAADFLEKEDGVLFPVSRVVDLAREDYRGFDDVPEERLRKCYNELSDFSDGNLLGYSDSGTGYYIPMSVVKAYQDQLEHGTVTDSQREEVKEYFKDFEEMPFDWNDDVTSAVRQAYWHDRENISLSQENIDRAAAFLVECLPEVLRKERENGSYKTLDDLVRLRQSLEGIDAKDSVMMFVQHPFELKEGIAYCGAWVDGEGSHPVRGILARETQYGGLYRVDTDILDAFNIDQIVKKLEHQRKEGNLIPVVAERFDGDKYSLDFRFFDKNIGEGGQYRHYPIDSNQLEVLDPINSQMHGKAYFDNAKRSFVCSTPINALLVAYAVSDELLHRNRVHHVGKNDYRVVVDLRNPSGLDQKVLQSLAASLGGKGNVHYSPTRMNEIDITYFEDYASAKEFADSYPVWKQKAIDAAVCRATDGNRRSSWINDEGLYVSLYIQRNYHTNSFRDKPCQELVDAIEARMKDIDPSLHPHAASVINELRLAGVAKMVNEYIGPSGRDFLLQDGVDTKSGDVLVGFHTIDVKGGVSPMVYVITDGTDGKRFTSKSLGDVDVDSLKEGFYRMYDKWTRNPEYRSPQLQQAVTAFRSRIVDPSARSFTTGQHDILRNLLDVFRPENTKAVADYIADATHSFMLRSGDRVPQKWEQDARKELTDLTNGVIRDAGQTIRR